MKIKKHLSFTSMRIKLSCFFKKIPDCRQQAKISISLHDILMSGFACMYFQDPSLLQFQTRMQEEQHRNNLQTLFGVEVIPKDTQMRECIDQVDRENFRDIFKAYCLCLQRNKRLEDYQILPGLYLVPMDGTEFFKSEKISCEHCLRKEHKEGEINYSHQALQGGIMHPDQSVIIPFMPEEIHNTDGTNKQDCEMNAAKRFVAKTRQDHPQLGIIFGGDGLFSRQPIIEDIIAKKAHYLFVAKPKDHKYLMDWVAAYPKLHEMNFSDEKGNVYCCEWMNNVPLSGREDSIHVNFFRCTIKTKDGKIFYRNGWVTDLVIDERNIKILVRAGRCRWKVENECFNVLKNHGYCISHNYGHGKENLCFNFYLLTALAFFFHQILEATDGLYQAARKKFGSKRHMWETLRAYIKIIIFDTWEKLLSFALTPTNYKLIEADAQGP